MARRAPLPRLGPYDLVDLAEVGNPASPTSPGAVFLQAFYDLMLQRHEEGVELDRLGDLGADLVVEAAPWRTVDLFRAYVDLAAWHAEDEFRQAGILDVATWPTAELRTKVVLELIGDRLARRIIDYHIGGLCPNHENADVAPAALDSGLCAECEPWVAEYPPPAV